MTNYWRIASDKEKRTVDYEESKINKKMLLSLKKKKKNSHSKKWQKKHAMTSNPTKNFLQVFFHNHSNTYMKTTVYAQFRIVAF